MKLSNRKQLLNEADRELRRLNKDLVTEGRQIQESFRQNIGLLNETRKPLNEAKGGVIDQLYDVIDSDPTVENKIEDEIEKYSQKIRKEYINKLNSGYRSKLQSLVGKVITEKDVVAAERKGLDLPFYNPAHKDILGSPIKSASFIFFRNSAGNYFLRLSLKFENGKSFDF